MAVLPIRIYPDPVLREAARPVEVVDEGVRKLARDMAETMEAAPGIGLAAPQIGVQRRVLVYDLGEDLRILVNPEIVDRRGEETDDEGCLSIPGLSYPVRRSAWVRVRGVDEDGDPLDYEADELEARVIQHEIDHLDGVLFLDRLDRDVRREAMRIMRERALRGEPTPVPRTPAGRF